MIKKIAVLTSGGDAPGMNACIRAVVKSALNLSIHVLGIEDGFQGMIQNRISALSYKDVDNIIYRGGTFLGTARSEEFRTKAGREKAYKNLLLHQIDGLIVIGGDGSFEGSRILSEEMSIPVIGIPATIDNDIVGTDHTIGYDTCLNTVVEAIDKIRDTAGSHHRVFFVEVMGRNSGFIALNVAIASGAEAVLIPEEVTNITDLVTQIKEQNKGSRSSIIIVAEGDDAGGAQGIMLKVAPFLPNYDLRYSVLGHMQRGGTPSAFDRILATRMGDFAVESLVNGVSKQMITANGDQIGLLPFSTSMTQNAGLDLSKLTLLQRLLTQR